MEHLKLLKDGIRIDIRNMEHMEDSIITETYILQITIQVIAKYSRCCLMMMALYNLRT